MTGSNFLSLRDVRNSQPMRALYCCLTDSRRVAKWDVRRTSTLPAAFFCRGCRCAEWLCPKDTSYRAWEQPIGPHLGEILVGAALCMGIPAMVLTHRSNSISLRYSDPVPFVAKKSLVGLYIELLHTKSPGGVLWSPYYIYIHIYIYIYIYIYLYIYIYTDIYILIYIYIYIYVYVIIIIIIIVFFTSQIMFSIAILPHSTGVVYYHLLLRPEFPGLPPSLFE